VICPQHCSQCSFQTPHQLKASKSIDAALKIHAITLATIFFATTAHAGDFAECILDNMPGTSNVPAALAVYRSCANETAQANEAFMIAAACRCLYGKPEFKGQTCANP